MIRFVRTIVFAWAFLALSALAADLHLLQYEGFQLLFDCDLKSATRFSYTTGKDTGSLKRRSSFSKDPNFSSDCQQNSSNSYSGSDEAFDRGHLVPANHLDHLKLGIYQSNYFTNILPQARNMNRGAWLRTEEIIECYRDIEMLRVYGGPIFSNERDRDFFSETHGIRTPSAFWKIVIKGDDQIAWIIPNSADAKRGKLDDYLVSVNQIERAIDEVFYFIDDEKKSEPTISSWELPEDCDLS